MAYNARSKATTIKYIEENLDTIRFRVRRGEKAALEQYAREAGYSAYSRFIIDAINDKAGRTLLTMPRERNKPVTRQDSPDEPKEARDDTIQA